MSDEAKIEQLERAITLADWTLHALKEYCELKGYDMTGFPPWLLDKVAVEGIPQ